MGTKSFPLNEQELGQLSTLRAQLRQLRALSGRSAAKASRDSGSKDFVVNMESARNQAPLMSSLQRWAGVLDARIEFVVPGVSDGPMLDPQFEALYRASRPWGADEQMRLFVVAAVRQQRILRGWDVEHLAPLLGQSGDSIRDWERNARDPMLSRVMVALRVTGGRLDMRVVARGEWPHA